MLTELLQSSIGKKALVAVSGLVLLGFVIAHLLGNLTIFLGPDGINAYAQKIHHLGWLLWMTRLVLLAMVVLHIRTTIDLALENRRARPVRYAVDRSQQTTLPAKTMVISGLFLFAFVGYHLAHCTFRVTHPSLSHLTDALGRDDVYSLVVLSFRQPLVAGFYLLAMALLCSHLAHGVASALQTLGLADDATLPLFKRIGTAVAVAIGIGYGSIPLAAWCGLLRAAGGLG